MNRILSLIAVLALAACGGSGAQLALSGRAGGATAAAISPNALTLSNGITVDRVRLALRDQHLPLSVVPSPWFGGSGSARLDPRSASNKSATENNIQTSMKVFEDDDHNGLDDSTQH